MNAFKLLGRDRSRAVPTVSHDDLLRRSQALREALDAGGQHLPPDQVEAVQALEAKVTQRTSIAGSRTVAALAGATGSGKSSVFNFLVGEPVSRIGARRPTTSLPTAAVWGEEPSAPLLDWLNVASRHQVTPGLPQSDELDGLVLLDLPDFDSRVSAHRDEADRVLDMVDVFVWVTDPQKYADAVLHDDYVRRLASHDTVTLVVLNQIDRLTPEQAQACANDLRQLMQRDGLTDAQVIMTSAVTSAGLADLAAELARVVQTRNAAEQRLLGDLRGHAQQLRGQLGETEPELGPQTHPALVDALSKAAGVPVVVQAVERDYKQHALRETGWPFTRWTTRLRAAPLKRLGLESVVSDDADNAQSRSDARALLGRSSLPPATPAARAAVEVTTRRLADEATAGLPPSWADAVHQAATPDDRSMVDALDRAVLSTPLQTRKPMWWTVFNILQWACAAVAVAGLLWLVVLGVLSWAQIKIDAPKWGLLPIPLLMLVVGIILGLLLAALARWLAGRAARRRAEAVDRELRTAVSGVAADHVIAPVEGVLAAHRATRTALDIAAA